MLIATKFISHYFVDRNSIFVYLTKLLKTLNICIFEPFCIDIELLLLHLFKQNTFKRGLFQCNEERLNTYFLVKYGFRNN